jgi:hypothetical protein
LFIIWVRELYVNPHSADIKENLGIKNSKKEKPEKIA